MNKVERLFFALWPEPEQQKAWATLAAELLPVGAGRLVPASNLHLTLLYVGGVAPEQRKALELMAAEISFSPFVLQLNRFGYWRKPKVWWWGATQTPESLCRLVQLLRIGAERCGIEVDQRSYKAHMTLARKVAHAPDQVAIQSCDWAVDRFALVSSVSSPAGVHYEPLRHWSA